MSEYESARSQSSIDDAYQNAEEEVKNIKSHNTMIKTALIAGVGIYCVQLIDAMIWGGGERPTANQMTYNPNQKIRITPDYSYSDGVGLTLSMKIGGGK